MDKERFDRLETVIRAAETVPADERETWLEDFCADAELKQDVRSFWEAEHRAGSFLEGTVGRYAAAVSANASTPTADKQFGSYLITREIGSGGMGAVFLGVRNDGQFDQEVAIKLIRQTLKDSKLVEQFYHERQILASLNHPNIAKLIDGGVTDNGEPFLVMEYIEGRPLLDYARRLGLDLRARLKLFLKICRGVSFAHRKLIVHRDIKPANILVTADGEPKLLDFGLAKALAEAGSDGDATVTAYQALTPAYASPEQLRGEAVTTSTDVYSLGVVLYELLTSRRPYSLEKYSYEDVLRAISTREPAVPSSSANNDAKPAGIARPLLKGDIDNIVLMALRKEPERRYPSVEAFAADIEKFLDGKPVSARPNTVAYRTRKFIARNKISAAVGLLLVATLVVGVVAVVHQANVARTERDLANGQQAKAEKISQFLTTAFAFGDPTAASGGTKNKKDATISDMLDDLGPRVETQLADQPDVKAALQRTIGMAYAAQSKFDKAEAYLNASLQTLKALYGDDDQEVALTLSALGETTALKGDYKKGNEYLQSAVDIYHRHPPEKAAHKNALIAALVDTAGVAWTMGDFEKADQRYSEALDVATATDEAERVKVAAARAGLGLTRYGQGRLDEADAMLYQAVAEYRQIDDAKWALPETLNYLGQALLWSGRYNEALEALHESEDLSLTITGESSPSYQRSLWLQVFAECMAGRCAEARSVQDRSEKLRLKYFPENKVIAGNSFDAMALIDIGLKRYAQGEQDARRAIEEYQRSLPSGSPTLTLARVHLADGLIGQSKFDEARSVLTEAYNDSARGQGPDHWRTKMVSERLASLPKS